MADRVTVQALIDANLPDNTTEEITPEKHREVETSLNDNSFNKDSDTAVNVNYSPTSVNFDWLPEGDPTEVGGALDILAARTGKNPSDDIAFVSNSGSDTIGEFEIGNPLKPFLTIQAAINALPSNNSIVKVLGGTYSETVTITAKSNFVLDMSGCILNGTMIITASGFVSVNLKSGKILNTANSRTLLISGSSNVEINGGEIENTNSSTNSYSLTNAGGASFIGVRFNSQFRNTIDLLNCKFHRCFFDSLDISLFRTNGSNFYGCEIESQNSIGLQTQNAPNIFQYCVSLFKVFLCRYFYNTRIEGRTSFGMQTKGTSAELFFKDCDIIGATDCILIQLPGNRAATTNNIFQNCKLYAGTGNIFNEPTYGVGDLGNTQVINCIYNKAFTPALAPQKIFESNKTEIIGLQIPLK